jgi:hypothetical protein
MPLLLPQVQFGILGYVSQIRQVRHHNGVYLHVQNIHAVTGKHGELAEKC